MKLQSISVNFKQTQSVDKKNNNGILEKFHEKTKNLSDMNDTVVVPRTIFKGYLGFMSGTTLMTIGGLLHSKSKMPKTSLGLNIVGALIALFGTYSFVRPYIIKDAPGVLKKKEQAAVKN